METGDGRQKMGDRKQGTRTGEGGLEKAEFIIVII